MLELNENRYLGNLASLGLLTRDDEVELAKQLEQGQLKLLELFVTYDFSKSEMVDDDDTFIEILKVARKHYAKNGSLLQMCPVTEDIVSRLKDCRTKPRLLVSRFLQTKEFAAFNVRVQRKIRQQIDQASGKIERAYKGFVESNLKLVISIANKYRRSSMPLLDLIQEGNLGLIKAIGKFDYRKGYKFSTYATWWIRQTISRFLGNKGRFIRIPIQVLDVRKKVQSVRSQLIQQTGCEPTVEVIAETSEIPLKHVRGALDMCGQPTSLDAPVREGKDGCVGDQLFDDKIVSPQQVVMDLQTNERMHDVLSTLTPREEKMMRMRFGIG
ncbi:MAG: sigma-70 family RNA polymerase sigma factor, partial [Proteobacteria bacterium]|nr:sigma-70 family RNA polymerase sigma factor [Pseudomonadota bacterium]